MCVYLCGNNGDLASLIVVRPCQIFTWSLTSLPLPYGLVP